MDKLREASQKLQKFANDYVDEFETIGEDDEGREGYYSPNENERSLIADAVNGLIEDDDFVEMVAEYYRSRQDYRRANNQCLGCGAPSGTHWGERPTCQSPVLSAAERKEG